MNRIRRRAAAVLAVVGCAMAVAQPAVAQSPTISAYSGNGPSVQTKVGTPAHETLPFTGVDVGLVVGAGLALSGAGLALRRVALSRR